MSEKMIKRLESGNIGSALIMTVVLTVLLSMVAVMFVLVARMDSAATGNIADNKMLDSAVKSIIEIIGKELVFDTPGVAEKAGLSKLQYPQYYDYYDYPDINDAWLASIEPYKFGTDYYWRQISDVTGYLADPNQRFSRQNVPVKPSGSTVIREYPEIKLNADGGLREQLADADGDGIADSKWFELKQMRTSKGRPIYAAVRVIDNGGMININTAHSFNPDSDEEGKIDGSTPMQINLAGLLKGTDKIDDLHRARCDGNNVSWDDYRNKFILQFNDADIHYLPFDISDELELRYRYCIDSKFKSRIETNVPDTADAYGDPGGLYDTTGNWDLDKWQERITDPNYPKADRRHLLTTLSLDRIIDPDGSRMFNIVADTNAQGLYERLRGCIDVKTLNAQEIADANAYLAQFAANVVDLSDDDANISVVKDGIKEFYGMERPYIYISEITRNFQKDANQFDSNVHRSYAIELYKEFDDPCEFFDPWRLWISSIKDKQGSTSIRDIYIYPSDFNDRGGRYYVIIFEDDKEPNANLSDTVKFSDTPDNGAKGVDPNIILYWGQFFLGYDSNDSNAAEVWSNNYDFYIGTNEGNVKDANRTDYSGVDEHSIGQLGTSYNPDLLENKKYFWRVDGANDVYGFYRKGPVRSFTTWKNEPNSVYENIKYGTFIFDGTTIINLYRPVGASGLICVDRVGGPDLPLPNWLTNENDSNGGYGYGIKSFQRDIHWENRLKRIWCGDGNDPNTLTGTLGSWNAYSDVLAAANPIQPWYYNFKNVGDAAMVFVRSTYLQDQKGIDLLYRIPLGVPTTTEQYVRVDMNDLTIQNIFKYITVLRPNDPNETRVKGRINVNTAPAFIIRQLPWVSRVNRVNLNIAESIVAYRDKLDLSPPGPDYYHAGALNSRWQETGIKDISEANGFGSIGELLNVINKSGKIDYNIRYCGLDGRDQRGFPDLRVDFYSRADFMKDDLEEEELIFARLSDLVTVRSDMFTAYILVRIGTDGPQKRFIAILDRSGVTTADSRVSIKAFQLVPEAR